MKRVLVAGGAGYVGSVLVRKLLESGYYVRVLDLMLYDVTVFDDEYYASSEFELIQGDIRNIELVAKSLESMDIVIHLACISNDPSFDLDPVLGKSINYDCFEPFVKMAKEAEVERFIYASSSSVYGVKKEERVNEQLKLEPITDYSYYKMKCEEVLQQYCDSQFGTVCVRPATICGKSPRQRLDVIVNIFVSQAIENKKISVFGGEQIRPNLHIDDVCDFYVQLCSYPMEMVRGEVFNVGGENLSVHEIALRVQQLLGEEIPIDFSPTNDLRSYRICSDYIYEKLNFAPKKTVSDAILDLGESLKSLDVNSLGHPKYHNIKRIKEVSLK